MNFDVNVSAENVALNEVAPSMAEGTTLARLTWFYKTSLQATNVPTAASLSALLTRPHHLARNWQARLRDFGPDVPGWTIGSDGCMTTV